MAANKGISPEAQQLIKMTAPLVTAGALGYVAWKRNSPWQVVLIFVAGGYILSRIFLGSLLNVFTTIIDKPKQVYIAPGSLPDNFNAKQWADELRQDIYEVWGVRNNKLYDSIAAMSDSQLAAIGNAWVQYHFGKDKETLSQAMRGEHYWWSSYSTQSKADIIIAKLQAMGL